MKAFVTFLSIFGLLYFSVPLSAQPYNSTLSEEVRLILETKKWMDLDDLKGMATTVINNEVSLERLFTGSEKIRSWKRFDLTNFIILTVPDKSYMQLGLRPFGLAYELRREIVYLKSAEPDLPYRGHAALKPAFIQKCFLPQEQQPLDRGWSLRKLNICNDWKLEPKNGGKKYGEGILIGHPDTGYNKHIDLDYSRLRVDLGYDFVDNKQDPLDPLNYEGPGVHPGHGIGTGSVIVSEGTVSDISPPVGQEGGTGGPGKVTGIAPKSNLVPIRAVRSVIRIFSGNVARAIYHATKNKCQVISLSLGGLPSRALRASIEYAVNNNVIVVAAAGNCVNYVVYPAKYDICIAIAATNIKDKPWRGSAFGPSIDVSAPGEFVWRALRERNSDLTNRASGGQGTSYATANVAGVAALWLAHHGPKNLLNEFGPYTKLQFLFKRLLKENPRVPANWDKSRYGAGIIDAAALLDIKPSIRKKEAESDTYQFQTKKHFRYVDLITEILKPEEPLELEFEPWGAELIYILYNNPEILENFKMEIRKSTGINMRREILMKYIGQHTSRELMEFLTR